MSWSTDHPGPMVAIRGEQRPAPGAATPGRMSRSAGSACSVCGSWVRATLPLMEEVRQMTSVTVGVVRESAEGERRVALVPSDVEALCANEVSVVVQSGAGAGA